MSQHVTYSTTPWEFVRDLGAGDYAHRRLQANVEGCPYDIIINIKLTRYELMEMKIVSFDNVVFDMERPICKQEFEARKQLDARVHEVQRVCMQKPVHLWGVTEWDAECPWLFGNVPPVLDDEEMQAERDTWD